MIDWSREDKKQAKERAARAKKSQKLDSYPRRGKMKSGTEGWIRVTVLDYSDIMFRTPSGVATRGAIETYKVRFEEGKHKGEIRDVPANYVEFT